MKGKAKCRALKEIRKKIAQENDIEYAVSECTHKGDCKGTCPKCEAEVKYLERELEVRKKLGKAVAVAGVATMVMTNLTGCDFDDVKSGSKGSSSTAEKNDNKSSGKCTSFWKRIMGERGETQIDGEIDIDDGYEGEPEIVELDGDVVAPDEEPDTPSPEEPEELAGDVEYIEEEN